MSVPSVREARRLLCALFGRVAAAGPERTSAGHVERGGYIALEDDALVRLRLDGVRHAHRRQQGQGVGVDGVFVEFVRVRDLHDASEVHDRDAVRNVVDYQEVVGDEQVRDSELLLEFFEHIDDLGLDGNVQRRDRLVTDDEGRVYGQSAGNADALSLTAGKLVRVPCGVFGIQSDQFHEVQDLLSAVLLALVEVVDIQRLTDDVLDRHTGVQGRVGVLEDHLHLLAETADVLAGDLFALELEGPSGGLVQVQERSSYGGFSATGLTDEARAIWDIAISEGATSPMTWYYLFAFCGEQDALAKAEAADSTYCFPNRAEDVIALEMAKAAALRATLSPERNPKLYTLNSTLNSWGLLFDQEDRERVINDDNVVMTCRHYFTLPWDPRATDGSTWPEGGAMLIRLGKFDYLLAGCGVVVDFKTPTEKQQEQQKTLGEDGFAEAGANSQEQFATPHSALQRTANSHKFNGKRLGLLSVDEVSVSNDGTMQYLRRHNGDQTHQGRHARIGIGEWKILHIRLYEY